MANPLRRIPWPVTTGTYRFNIGNLRQRLDEVYDWLRKTKGTAAKTEVGATIGAFMTKAGIDFGVILPATSAVVINSQDVPMGDATGDANGRATGSAIVEANAVTRVNLPSTAKVVKSAVKYTGPAITGSYVNGYTFTIVNGQITAIVAS